MFDVLTPDFVSVATPSEAPATFQLTAEERAASARFSEKRLADFANGRRCAHAALAKLGVAGVSVGVGRSRQPKWPHGIVGSITHTADLAVAAVCRRTNLVALGIDCEQLGRLDPAMLRILFHSDELRALSENGFDDSHADVLFSAKESVYKCIWRFVRRFVDFKEVRVALEPEADRFTVTAANATVDESLLHSIIGRWARDEHFVYTVASIPAGRAD